MRIRQAHNPFVSFCVHVLIIERQSLIRSFYYQFIFLRYVMSFRSYKVKDTVILFARVDAHAFDIALIAIGRCKYRRGYEISAHDAHIDSPSSSTLIVKRLKKLHYLKIFGNMKQ
jgi:hypothetical protein